MTTTPTTLRKIGTQAPAFSLLDQAETERSLQDYLGHWVVLYFYPKDDTPGCTTEACTIAGMYDEFQELGVTVLGMSKDTPRSHQRFAEKYSLPFTLLSDPEMQVIAKYGAFKEKKMFGKPARGTQRVTYVIDPTGKIARVYPDVDPASHALELLTDLRELLAEQG